MDFELSVMGIGQNSTSTDTVAIAIIVSSTMGIKIGYCQQTKYIVFLSNFGISILLPEKEYF